MNKKVTLSECLALGCLLVINLIIGALVLLDFGESWDEYNFFQYAGESLQAYAHLGDPNYIPSFSDPTLRYYGPWFLMLIVLVSRLFPGWIISDIAHIMTFLLFQGGIVIFYMLARRWLQPLPAFGATLLFATQPVLWGHAFINARDIPFMVGFLAVIHFGLRMIDSLSAKVPALTGTKAPAREGKDPSLAASLLRADLAAWSLRLRFLLPLIFLAGIALFAWMSASLVSGWLASAVLKADITSARDLDLYLRPVLARAGGVLLFAACSLLWALLLFLPVMPHTRAHLWTEELRPVLARIKGVARSRHLWIASLFLGLTVATRVLGLAAGALVVLFLLRKHGRAALLAGTAYLVLALPLVVLTWPYLWSEPLLRLLITLRVMLKFPWSGKVLFDGALYAGNELPGVYLPKLLLFQLTEPVILLLALAAVILLWQVFKEKAQVELVSLALLWFGLPLAAAALGSSYLYDNFRQLLFALPPLFLLAGVGLQGLFKKINNRALNFALLAVLVFPGIFGAARLHPYEYIYYNSFTGGLAGAQGRYELDYWGTSMRAVAAYANETLPPDAAVVVWGPPTSFWRYARPDITVYDSRDPSRPEGEYYAVILRRANADLLIFPGVPALHVAGVRSVPLAALKFIAP